MQSSSDSSALSTKLGSDDLQRSCTTTLQSNTIIFFLVSQNLKSISAKTCSDAECSPSYSDAFIFLNKQTSGTTRGEVGVRVLFVFKDHDLSFPSPNNLKTLIQTRTEK